VADYPLTNVSADLGLCSRIYDVDDLTKKL